MPIVSDWWLAANTEPVAFDVATVSVFPDAVTVKSPIESPPRVPAHVAAPKPPEMYGGLTRSASDTPPMVPRTSADGGDANVNVTALVAASRLTVGMFVIAHGVFVRPSVPSA